MNTILLISSSLLSAFFPQTLRPHDGTPTYTCAPLAWTTPATMGSDGHLRGTASVTCNFLALSGGGFPELANYELAQLKKEATTINSGPTGTTLDSLPGETYDFNMNLTFSSTTVNAHELGTIATDHKTRLVSQMNTESISGSDYDAYLKGLDLILDVTPDASTAKHYNATLSVTIDFTKPWYAPEGVFVTDVTNAAATAVNNYETTVMSEIQNNI